MSSENYSGRESGQKIGPLCRRILFYQRNRLGQASGGGEDWNSPDPLAA